MGYPERLADSKDPLRVLLRAARSWQVPPSVFIGQRTVDTADWKPDLDTPLALALEDYEAGLCPGGEHVLAETSLDDRRDAYRPGEPVRCHYCTAQAMVSENAAEQKDAAGLLVPLVLDESVVALNRLPAPPVPPELLPSA